MTKLRRIAARLRHVQAREVPHRLRQQWIRWQDRRRKPPPTPDGPPPIWPVPATTIGPATALPRQRPTAVDPATGFRWSEGAADAIDLLGAPADPRRVWETGRLQHEAAAAASHPTEVLERTRAFLAENPMGTGVHWASTLEPALRLVSLVRIGAALGTSELRPAIHHHAYWIARYPSLGSSANNHRVAELAALALAARALPDLPAAPSWWKEAQDLVRVLSLQLHEDGVGAEQSPSYLAFDLECALVARAAGIGGLEPSMAAGAAFLATLIDDGGHAPAIGDDDGGCVLAHGDQPYVLSIAGAVASALGATAPIAWSPDARARALGIGPAPSRRRGSRSFAGGGVTVLVHGRARVIVDHGPLGGLFLAAHGRADALSCWLHLDGRPVIVSRGPGVYNADPAARRFHRGSSGQPTVVVDGRDQSEPHDHPFLWSSRAQTRLESVDLASRTVVASHDGYRTLGVTHRRTVRLTDDTIEWVDELDGDGTHHIAILLPLAPGLTSIDDRVLDGDRTVLTIEPDPRCRLHAVTAGERPGLGWHSPSYGSWVEATGLSSTCHARLPVRLITTLRFG